MTRFETSVATSGTPRLRNYFLTTAGESLLMLLQQLVVVLRMQKWDVDLPTATLIGMVTRTFSLRPTTAQRFFIAMINSQVITVCACICKAQNQIVMRLAQWCGFSMRE